MDVFSFAINESQWMLCLIQVTGLMLIGWIIGRITLRKFPDVSASIGAVVLAASAGLIMITLADVPRPFELTASPHKVTSVSGLSNTSVPSVYVSEVDAKTNEAGASWLNRLTSLISFSLTPIGSTDTTDNSRQFIAPERLIGLPILLTLLGGLVGILRVAHSSRAIWVLVKSSSPIDGPYIRAEVARIVALLPTSFSDRDISVHRFNGPGSPFVSWLTGNRIFVPETFLDWSKSEQSTGLAHEISHLQRRDHFCRLLTELTFCLNWLHPLAWILHRQTVLAQELAADQLAAQTTANPSAYCRGLSRLALRFDAQCRHPSALGVSVSSSLIRRITMLREITFHRLPRSRQVHRCITLSTLVACTWIACWSVEGQTANQDQGKKGQVDSKVVAASHTVPVKMFSQPVTQPWDTLGDQPGYLNLQLNRILEHPDLNPHIPIATAAIDQVLRTKGDATATLKKFGLSLEDITQIQGTFMVSLGYDPDQPNGQRSSLNLGMSTAEVSTVNEVDWPGLINTIDLPTLVGSDLPEDYFKKLNEAWLKSATKSRSMVFPNVHLKGTAAEHEPPTETKKAAWKAVSGGIATVVYDLGQTGEAPKDYKEEDEWNQANLEMTSATETAAWGLDLSPDNKSCQIRFVAVPKAGVSIDTLLNKFDAVRDQYTKAFGTTDDERYKDFFQQWKKIKVSVVNGKEVNGEKTKDYLLVEGECSSSFLIKAWVLSRFHTNEKPTTAE